MPLCQSVSFLFPPFPPAHCGRTCTLPRRAARGAPTAPAPRRPSRPSRRPQGSRSCRTPQTARRRRRATAKGGGGDARVRARAVARASARPGKGGAGTSNGWRRGARGALRDPHLPPPSVHYPTKPPPAPHLHAADFHHAHLVGRQRARLVGADDGRAPQSLHARQRPAGWGVRGGGTLPGAPGGTKRRAVGPGKPRAGGPAAGAAAPAAPDRPTLSPPTQDNPY
jgi:hypothetical protein